MIDREARNRLAELTRHLVAGIITNDDFGDEAPYSREDPAIQEVFFYGPYCLYSDYFCSYRLTGRHALSQPVRREAARWVLFLKSNLEYEWPREPHWSFCLWVLANILTLNLAGFVLAPLRYKRFAQSGDIEVWPFLRRSDFEEALSRPCYLKEQHK